MSLKFLIPLALPELWYVTVTELVPVVMARTSDDWLVSAVVQAPPFNRQVNISSPTHWWSEVFCPGALVALRT